jgi:glycogen debranching enzyme
LKQTASVVLPVALSPVFGPGRYHGLLVPATMPPAGRTVLVNGIEAWVELAGSTFAISSQRYNPDVLYPDGVTRLTSFRVEPWPTWTFELGGGIVIEQEFLQSTAPRRWPCLGS